jgi:hypothetical protein
MPDEIRGIAEPEDIRSRGDALRLLDIDDTATSEDISQAVTDIIPEAHPDTGGTAELFRAVQLAEDALTGEARIVPGEGRAAPTDADAIDISIVGGGSPSTSPDVGGGADVGADDFDDFTADEPAGGTTTSGPSPGDFGGFGSDERTGGESVGFGQTGSIDPEEIADEIEQILRDRVDEEDIKEQYGDVANFRNVSEILAAQFLQGNITIGQIEQMVGTEERAGSVSQATGGLFSNNPSDTRVGGGTGNPNFSSDPRDSQYSPGNVNFGDDDEDDDGDG